MLLTTKPLIYKDYRQNVLWNYIRKGKENRQTSSEYIYVPTDNSDLNRQNNKT